MVGADLRSGRVSQAAEVVAGREKQKRQEGGWRYARTRNPQRMRTARVLILLSKNLDWLVDTSKPLKLLKPPDDS
jgi:hypothetical protein